MGQRSLQGIWSGLHDGDKTVGQFFVLGKSEGDGFLSLHLRTLAELTGSFSSGRRLLSISTDLYLKKNQLRVPPWAVLLLFFGGGLLDQRRSCHPPKLCPGEVDCRL